MLHHGSIRTQDIHRAMAFYQRLGFTVQERFTTGMTLACWMEGLGARIELIQVPLPRPPADAFSDEHYTGYYHLSFDLTDQVDSLPAWLATLEQAFAAETGPGSLQVLLVPQQQQIGDRIYEVAFIADADGLPLEFIRILGHVQSP
ncbi:MAG TPA: VOC family protein [Leptolyngbyaceae cyanobacterium M65_K2018_010]|nr:VOC family protein [Leptolyngbyaceae cyanobacterium M65_K2018_010]